MATAAELVMAPSAARPETAGARKDAPADAGETSFAEMLDDEVQATSDAGAPAAAQAAIAPQAQPAPAPVATSTFELLISLQSADTLAAQPSVDATEATPATPAVVAPVVTPEIDTAAPMPAAPAPTPVAAPQTGQTTALPAVKAAAVPQAAVAMVAVTAVAAAAPKAAPTVVTGAQEVETDASAPAEKSSTDAKTVGADTDPAAVIATPIEDSAAPATTTPAQATIVAAAVPAPKPTASGARQPAWEAAPTAQPATNSEAAAAETQAASPKSDTPAPNPASAQTTNAVKPQTGVQLVAANAAPDMKVDAPAPNSSSTSTSFADLLARGAPADTGKPAATHPAMQSAPQAVAQVYTRFIERFDGRAQRFEVRLDPAELGRVDVRIEIGADKKVHAVLAAHDSAALSDLMRGQRALERALTDAGIDLKNGGLKFELANDSNRGLAGQEQRRDAWSAEETNVWRGFSTVDVPVEASADATIAANAYPWRATRLDLVA